MKNRYQKQSGRKEDEWREWVMFNKTCKINEIFTVQITIKKIVKTSHKFS